MLFGGVVGAGATLSKEKTVGSSIDDRNIWTKIKAGFLEHNKEVEGILTKISVEVSEGRVLLTGTLNTPEERLIVLKIVWEQAGVREVINEIKLPEETTPSGVKQYTTDTWITTQVKSKMLMNNHVRSINFSIETIDGVVYALGIARTEEELSAIRSIAENVNGVTRFVSYIRVNSKPTVKEQENTQVVKTSEEEKVYPKEIKEESAPAHKEQNTEPEHEEEIEIEYLDSDD